MQTYISQISAVGASWKYLFHNLHSATKQSKKFKLPEQYFSYQVEMEVLY